MNQLTWNVEKADCIDFLNGLPEESVDLVFGSPPYESARLYLEERKNLGVARWTGDWVLWMADVYEAAQRSCKGIVAFVVAGQTRNYRWSAGPALLVAELHRRGMNLRNPAIFYRLGIPGSGGKDWLKANYEWIVCTSRPGRLPWSDITACGHEPKYPPGGAMSYRNEEGVRKNARGYSGEVKSRLGRGMANGIPGSTKGSCLGRRVPAGKTLDGKLLHEDVYLPPDKANPGNVLQQTYTADEVSKLLAEQGDVRHLVVGGGQMDYTKEASETASKNEAPFPAKLPEFFIRTFCPLGGMVCDPFSGSGTTAAMAKKHGRSFVGCDLRQSQVNLTLQRLEQQKQEVLFT